jgi:molybdate transport system substrate-binding protein
MGTEITVMSSGSAEPGLDYVVAAFEKATGHRVKITYNEGARGTKRLQDGDFDVVVATSNAIERMFRANGLVEPGGASVGRAGLGVIVRPGARVPDISNPDALKRAALAADALLLTSETSGIYIEQWLKKVGIYEQVKAKITHYHSAPEIVERALRGTGNEVGFMPINAAKNHLAKGIVVVGPLPEEAQFYREFFAVPTSHSVHKDVAWEFVCYCGGPGRPLFTEHGLV